MLKTAEKKRVIVSRYILFCTVIEISFDLKECKAKCLMCHFLQISCMLFGRCFQLGQNTCLKPSCQTLHKSQCCLACDIDLCYNLSLIGLVLVS